jgi:hypothetical protein
MNTGTCDMKVIWAIPEYFRIETSKNIYTVVTRLLQGQNFMCKEVESYQSVIIKNEFKYIFIV